MSKKGKKGKKTKKKIAMKKLKIKLFLILIIALIIFAVIRLTNEEVHLTKAMKTLDTYMSYINEAKYDEMYEMLSESSKKNITKENFIARNEEMYGQIEASSITVSNMSEEDENRKSKDSIYK